MPRRIVLLGGGFSDDADQVLDEHLLGLVEAEHPKVCFVPTASGDSADYIDRFHAAYPAERAEATDLQLFRRTPGDLRERVLGQHVVYVGGGNTANLLAVWRLHGLDAIMREAYEAGVVLCGISAGAACWFEACLTDSFGGVAALGDGLALLQGSFCPHLDSEPEREPSYRHAVSSGELPSGWGLDDGVAAVFEDEQLAHVVARRQGARLVRFEATGVSSVIERVLEPTLIGGETRGVV